MFRKYFILATFLLLALLLAGPVMGGVVQLNSPAGQELVKDKQLTKVTHDMVALQEEHKTHVQSRSLEPFKSSNPYVRVTDQYVVVDAVASGKAKDLLADLEELGLRNGATFGRMVSGRLPIEAIEELKNLDSLKFVMPAYMGTNVGSVTSQGDEAMRADIARDTFGVDGSGMTVGTLSDSFDCLGGAAGDVASGDLPAEGVTVLQEISNCSGATDEGRAMIQLTHDASPGVSHAFHSAFNGQADFAQGIIDLANFGADVIVDDVFYRNAPFFQDGIIAQAANEVYGMGIPYFSSAGNHGRNAYESPFVDSGVPGFFTGSTRHDFDPGSGVDDLQTITFPPGGTILSFQWSSPYASACTGCPGATSDLDILVYNMAGAFIGGSFSTNTGGDPIELLVVTISGSQPVQLQIGLELFSGTAPDRIKYIYWGQATIDEHDTASGTVFGHPNAVGAEAVGAAFFDETPEFGQDPPLLEPFSSAGTTDIFFDPAGNPLPSPETRDKPEIVAPDGTNTTFFGSDVPQDPDVFPNFFGTSAAAPHAAGVAALMLEQAATAAAALNNNSPLTPDQIYQALESTAIDMGDPGYDNDSGFGLIQADLALGGTPTVPVVQPDEGTIGSEITIDGNGFGDKKGKVLIGKSKCKVSKWTDKSISCVLNKVSKTTRPDTFHVTVQPKGKGIGPIVLEDAFSIRKPDIQAVAQNGSASTITGSFFGNKKVKALLVVDQAGKRKKMKINSLTMNPKKGTGQLKTTVSNKVLKKLEPGSYDVILTNQFGEDTFPNGFTVEGGGTITAIDWVFTSLLIERQGSTWVFYQRFAVTGPSGNIQITSTLKEASGGFAKLDDLTEQFYVEQGKEYEITVSVDIFGWGRCGPLDNDVMIFSSPAATSEEDTTISPIYDPSMEPPGYKCVTQYSITDMSLGLLP